MTSSFEKRLREALDLKSMTQSELSSRSGLSKSIISNYLSGRYKAKSQNLYLLAKALNVSEAWLMGFDVGPERELPAILDNDGQLSEFVELFNRLSNEQQTLIISQIKGILSNQ